MRDKTKAVIERRKWFLANKDNFSDKQEIMKMFNIDLRIVWREIRDLPKYEAIYQKIDNLSDNDIKQIKKQYTENIALNVIQEQFNLCKSSWIVFVALHITKEDSKTRIRQQESNSKMRRKIQEAIKPITPPKEKPQWDFSGENIVMKDLWRENKMVVDCA